MTYVKKHFTKDTFAKSKKMNEERGKRIILKTIDKVLLYVIVDTTGFQDDEIQAAGAGRRPSAQHTTNANLWALYVQLLQRWIDEIYAQDILLCPLDPDPHTIRALRCESTPRER
ncbi:hypothetical protein KM043_013415 [Ampulex compressa]|nr:hypothetical protein KM043_013415 [Ampulex compressa]